MNVRPFVKHFLKKVSRYYQIYIFTASTFTYANVVVNFLDPKSKYITGILDRNYCKDIAGVAYVKDLRIVRNRDLKDICIVDNMSHSFALQKSNGIPILSWLSDKNDTELKFLSDYLIEASFKDNLMTWNEENLRLSKLESLKEKHLKEKVTSIVF